VLPIKAAEGRRSVRATLESRSVGHPLRGFGSTDQSDTLGAVRSVTRQVRVKLCRYGDGKSGQQTAYK